MGVGVRDNSNTLYEFSGSGSETKGLFALSPGKWDIKITVDGAAKVKVFDANNGQVFRDFHKNAAKAGAGGYAFKRFPVQVDCSVNVVVSTNDLLWQGQLKKL